MGVEARVDRAVGTGVGVDEGRVEERRRPALSPSRAADFKQCPLLYRFRAVDRLPETPSPAAVRGTVVHAVLERLFDLPAAQRVPATAKALLAEVWAEIAAEAPELVAVIPEPAPAAPTAPVEPAAPAAAAPEPAESAVPAAPVLSGTVPTDAVPLDAVPIVAVPTDVVPALADGVPAPADGVPAVPDPAPETSDPAPRTVELGESRPGDPGSGQPSDSTPDRIGVWLAGAAELLDTYFAMEDPRALEPGERELLVEAELGSGVPLRGYLDRLDVDGAGRFRIVDYKTGAAPRESGESRALFQMKFYALALLQLRGEVPEQLRLVYLGRGGEELTYRPDAAELRRFQRVLEAIWAAIVEADRTGDFRPNRGPGCSWCDHKALCPAWEGTPPAYPGWPELRGEAPTAPFGAAS